MLLWGKGHDLAINWIWEMNGGRAREVKDKPKVLKSFNKRDGDMVNGERENIRHSIKYSI